MKILKNLALRKDGRVRLRSKLAFSHPSLAFFTRNLWLHHGLSYQSRSIVKSPFAYLGLCEFKKAVIRLGAKK